MKKAIDELFDALKFYRDSKRGKYSLDTYLDIIGEYADRQILEAEQKEGLKYLGGQCEVWRLREDAKEIHFAVHLYFSDENGENIEKEACRDISIAKFVRETQQIIGTEKQVFDIEDPGRRER